MQEYLKRLKETNNDDESIRSNTEIENAFNEKKYGLVWEEHSEKVDEMAEHNIPVFVENKNRKIVVNEEATSFDSKEIIIICISLWENRFHL